MMCPDTRLWSPGLMRPKAVLKLGVAAAIVASTYYAIVRIAEHKADALAGGETFVLDRRHAAESEALEALSRQLRGWGEDDLAASLARLQGAGHLWVAPRLSGGRSAVYVNALGLVSRIYVRGDELVSRSLPFPDLDIPESARRTFARIRLAGTLVHELQHYQGVEDEEAVYEREMAWYRGLGERTLDRLHGEERRWFEWAVESALESAKAARAKASGTAEGGRGGANGPKRAENLEAAEGGAGLFRRAVRRHRPVRFGAGTARRSAPYLPPERGGVRPRQEEKRPLSDRSALPSFCWGRSRRARGHSSRRPPRRRPSPPTTRA